MRSLMLIIAASLLLSGCSGDDDSVGPSADCLAHMEATAGIPTSAPERVAVSFTKTLNACGTADEWLEALRAHPGAMGLTSRAVISDMDLQVVCWENESTPVCVDAASQGRL